MTSRSGPGPLADNDGIEAVTGPPPAPETHPERQRLSIVVPAYQDADTLSFLFDRLAALVPTLALDTELVLVDDGSHDATAMRATELARSAPFETTILRLARNFGQHPAVFAGLAQANGDVVVTMDSDLQYPPEAIPDLLAGLSPETPVVSGRRVHRSAPLTRRMITRFLSSWLSRRTGVKLEDYGSMFRAYQRSVVDQLLGFREHRRYIPGLVAWLGVGVREVPIVQDPTTLRESRYRLTPLVDLFLDLITGYSTFPLRLGTVIGLLAAAISFGLTVTFGLYRLISGGGPSGLVSAFGMLFFLVGVQLAILGALGEYVGRIYIEAKGRPYYLVSSVERFDASGRPRG